MSCFTDTKGRSWEVKINIGVLKRIKSLTGIDLLDAETGILSSNLSSPVIVCDILFATVKPQADSIGVSDIDFGESMNGEILEKAQELLYIETANFFPKPRREIMMALLGKSKEISEKVLKEVQDTLSGAQSMKLQEQ